MYQAPREMEPTGRSIYKDLTPAEKVAIIYYNQDLCRGVLLRWVGLKPPHRRRRRQGSCAASGAANPERSQRNTTWPFHLLKAETFCFSATLWRGEDVGWPGFGGPSRPTSQDLPTMADALFSTLESPMIAL